MKCSTLSQAKQKTKMTDLGKIIVTKREINDERNLVKSIQTAIIPGSRRDDFISRTFNRL